MVIKNRIVNKVALDEDTDEVARETPQSVETLLKPLFLTLIPGYKSGPTVDLSDLNLDCRDRRGTQPNALALVVNHVCSHTLVHLNFRHVF